MFNRSLGHFGAPTHGSDGWCSWFSRLLYLYILHIESGT